jgi:hypothetical protein
VKARQYLAVGAVFAVIALTGVGYSVFTSQITLSASAGAGSLVIQWVGPGTPPVSTTTPNVTCTATLTPSQVRMTVTGLYPGQSCTMVAGNVKVQNTGSLPADISGVYVAGAVTGPSTPCAPLNFTVIDPPYSPYLAPGASFPWYQTAGLGAGAGNGCQGDSFTFTIWFNATVA